jgi:hypothetical protein
MNKDAAHYITVAGVIEDVLGSGRHAVGHYGGVSQ